MPKLREQQADDGAGPGEHEALGEQLTHEPPRAGAERRADGQLALARRRAREQQVRDVRAGDQQHEDDGAHQRQDRLPDVRRPGPADRLDVEVQAGRLLGREALAQLGGDADRPRPAPARPWRRASAGRGRARPTLFRLPCVKSMRIGDHTSGRWIDAGARAGTAVPRPAARTPMHFDRLVTRGARSLPMIDCVAAVEAAARTRG